MTSNVDEDVPLPQDAFFRLSETDDDEWEIDRPQQAIFKLVEKGLFHGQVLDAGCGVTDNAIYIVTHTNNVAKAIEVAREKAKKLNLNIQFEVVNMLEDVSKTNLKQHSFDILLDAAIFHVFSNDDRLVYIKNLEYLIKPGGLYFQIVFSEKESRRIRKDELFSSINGWTIESIEDTIYEGRPNTQMGLNTQAYLSLIRRNKYN